jgi:anti-anti-sigma regulatory factor
MVTKPEKSLTAVVRIENGTALVTIRGSGGVHQAEEILPMLETAVAQGVDRIVVDLGELEYSAALVVGAALASFVKSCPTPVRIELLASRRQDRDALTSRLGEDRMPRRLFSGRASGARCCWRTIPVSWEAEERQPVHVDIDRP